MTSKRVIRVFAKDVVSISCSRVFILDDSDCFAPESPHTCQHTLKLQETISFAISDIPYCNSNALCFRTVLIDSGHHLSHTFPQARERASELVNGAVRQQAKRSRWSESEWPTARISTFLVQCAITLRQRGRISLRMNVDLAVWYRNWLRA